MNEDLQFPYNFAIKGNKDYFVSMKLHKLFKDLGAVKSIIGVCLVNQIR